MSLLQAYTGLRILETGENYARADEMLRVSVTERRDKDTGGVSYFSDEYFWQDQVMRSSWNTLFYFDQVVLSEWLPRVPGLFWHPASEQLRRLSPAMIERQSERWTVYEPLGKSRKVMGGIGTFRLSPAPNGARLVSLTTTANASAGIPVLVSPEVWDRLAAGRRLSIFRTVRHWEGIVLSGRGRWQPMAQGWAERFRCTRDIPRGYLVLDNPDTIRREDMEAPVQVHPFTIMEYRSGSKQLYDYVYATADTGAPSFRGELARFFDAYRDDRQRYGRYLLAGDMIDPLWDSEYDSPADLRRTDGSASSQLDLLEARVRESMMGTDTVERLLELLGSTSTNVSDLRRLSLEIDIQPAFWRRGGSLAEMASQLVDETLRQGKLDALLEAVALEYPERVSPKEV